MDEYNYFTFVHTCSIYREVVLICVKFSGGSTVRGQYPLHVFGSSIICTVLHPRFIAYTNQSGPLRSACVLCVRVCMQVQVISSIGVLPTALFHMLPYRL